MKFLFYLILMTTLNCFSQANFTNTININGQNRTYKIYIPAIYNSLVPVPLVFNFHGYTSNSQDQEIYADFRSIADTANFILIHPQGLDIGNGTGWNSFLNTDASNYDYQFVEQLIDDILLNYSIDTNRIYSTGLSNGGFFSYDLACFMSHRFAAVASVAGSMISSHLATCNPGRPIPILQIHGTNDLTVTYNGVGGIINCTGIEDLIDFWKNYNSCELNPIIENIPNTNTSDLSTVEKYTYQHTTNLGNVELFKVINGSHTWPGSSIPLFGLATNQDISASKEIWRFFSQHSKSAGTSNLIEKELELIINYNYDENLLIFNDINTTIKTITLINNLGQNIHTYSTENKTNFIIDVQFLKEGFYFVNIGNQTKRFIKF